MVSRCQPAPYNEDGVLSCDKHKRNGVLRWHAHDCAYRPDPGQQPVGRFELAFGEYWSILVRGGGAAG